MSFYSMDNSEKLFFADSNLGIITYNDIKKILILYEFSSDKIIYKSFLKEIVTLNNVEEKNIFKDLYLHTKNDFLKSRFETPLNKEFNFFVGKTNNEIVCFSRSEKFLSFFGAQQVEQIKSKVIQVYQEKEEILKEINDYKNNQKYFYGFWNIKDDDITSSFLFKNLNNTRVCFSDFGKKYLKEGSLFLKFEMLDLEN